MPTWQRLLAALTQTSKIFPISSSVRVGFSPVVPQGTMPAVLPGRAPGGGGEYFCRLSRLDVTGCAGEAAGQTRVHRDSSRWMDEGMHARSIDSARCSPRGAVFSPLLAVPVNELADLVVVNLIGVGEGGHEGHVGPGHSELRHLAEENARRQHSRMQACEREYIHPYIHPYIHTYTRAGMRACRRNSRCWFAWWCGSATKAPKLCPRVLERKRSSRQENGGAGSRMSFRVERGAGRRVPHNRVDFHQSLGRMRLLHQEWHGFRGMACGRAARGYENMWC